jgi:hypothetical protein
MEMKQEDVETSNPWQEDYLSDYFLYEYAEYKFWLQVINITVTTLNCRFRTLKKVN